MTPSKRTPPFLYRRVRRCLMCLGTSLCLLSLPLYGQHTWASTSQGKEDVLYQADVVIAEKDTIKQADSAARPAFWHRGLVGKVVRYFEASNTPKPREDFDMSFIGGPFYNKTAGVGLGLCGSALYHLQPSNPLLPQSSLALTAQATTLGMFELNLKGYHYFPDDRYRSDLSIELSTFKTLFWGNGFAQSDKDANETSFVRNQLVLDVNFMRRFAPHAYVGPSLYYSLYYADKREAWVNTLLGDAPRHSSTLSFGLLLRYDTRDFALDAKRGIYLNVQQRVAPTWLGNGGLFTTSEMNFRGFHPLWRDCTLAGEVHALLNCGAGLPWTEMAQVGSNDRMRGYYEGRYRDRNLVEGQIELRQHIKGRHGVVAFVGLANVFRDTHTWRLRHTLYNYGIGYRWRFKPGVNIRLDCGFTRKGPGFIFAVNEAF